MRGEGVPRVLQALAAPACLSGVGADVHVIRQVDPVGFAGLDSQRGAKHEDAAALAIPACVGR